MKKVTIAVLITIALAILASSAMAQRLRFPDFFQRQPAQGPGVQVLPAPSQVFQGGGFGQAQGPIIGAPQQIFGAPQIIGSPQTIVGAPQQIIGAPQGAIFGGGAGQGVFGPPATIGTPNFNPAPVFDPFRSSHQALPFSTRPSINAANTAPSLSFPRNRLQILPPVQQGGTGFGVQQQGLGAGGFGLPNVGAGGLGLPNVGGGLGLPNVGGRFGLPSIGTGRFGLPNIGAGGLGLPNVGAGGLGLPNVGAGGVGLPNVGVGGVGLPSLGTAGFGFPSFFSGFSNWFPRSGQSGQFFRRFREEYLPRLFERPRIRHTFLPGGNGNELEIHDTEFATTLTLPRTFLTEQPVRITPGFIAHFWDGPETLGPFGTGFDLPETAFSAFLTLEHISNPQRRTGIESNFTVGIYSDYEHLDSDSLRITGVGLGWVRLNDSNLFKFGAEYFDRIDIKLLPAFGLFIRPTPDLQVDLYFPRPRIAQRIPNFRSLETWVYAAGEIGGGNWTVERIGGLDDRIDINDYRAILGIEGIGQGGVTRFAEIGYVFDRELVSDVAIPTRSLDLQDTIMIRLGVEF